VKSARGKSKIARAPGDAIHRLKKKASQTMIEVIKLKGKYNIYIFEKDFKNKIAYMDDRLWEKRLDNW
jgi:hypothetical protein